MALFDPLKVYGAGLAIDSVPCIIREILYAPPCPPEIAKLLEVALMHHNSSHYQLALQTYLRAQKSWMEYEFKKRKVVFTQEMERKKAFIVDDDSEETMQKKLKIEEEYTSNLEALANTELLTPMIQMYLRCAIGGVYESSGNDELALGEYMEAKKYSMKLDAMNPDQAIPYSSLGSVYVHLQQYDMAYQYFLRARELRESLLPPNHLDTAIILNNLAVCLHCTGKLVEAFELYKVSLKIFEEKVGLNHPRPILVKRNLTKAQDNFKFAPPKLEKFPIHIVDHTEKKEEKPKKKSGKKKK